MKGKGRPRLSVLDQVRRFGRIGMLLRRTVVSSVSTMCLAYLDDLIDLQSAVVFALGGDGPLRRCK